MKREEEKRLGNCKQLDDRYMVQGFTELLIEVNRWVGD